MVTTDINNISSSTAVDSSLAVGTPPSAKSEVTTPALTESAVFSTPATQTAKTNRFNQVAERIYDTFFGSQPDPVPRQTLTPTVTEEGKVKVRTSDGYTIRFEGANQEWWIDSPDGNKTRIWGDPHVEESDGTKWDFTETSSFVFGKNKVTVETIPTWNGKTFSRQVSIYNGDDRFTLSGIATDDLKFENWSFDAKAHDAKLGDGTVYKLNENGDKFSWQKQ